MTSPIDFSSLHPRGRAIFCLRLARALPSLPSDIEAKLGKTHLALIASVEDILESAASDDTVNLEDLCAKLSTLVSFVQLQALEIEKREYRPGDNCGFGGSADTYREIYRYLSAFVRTVADAAVLDVEHCLNTFRGALKHYGAYSVDGDPKGAIRQAIEDAEDEATKVIAETYASIPGTLRSWRTDSTSESPTTPTLHPSQFTPREASSPIQTRRFQVFMKNARIPRSVNGDEWRF